MTRSAASPVMELHALFAALFILSAKAVDNDFKFGLSDPDMRVICFNFSEFETLFNFRLYTNNN